jgi:uncharacterized protein
LRQTRVAYAAGDGVQITAWAIPAGGPDPTDFWLLICHGNQGNIGTGRRPAFYAAARDAGLSLLAFDYRGYGASTGAPDEPGLYEDAKASYAHLTRAMGVPPDRIVIFGHSLGTGVAIELATRAPAAGLILEAPYTSIVEIGQARYPFIPVSLIASQRFPSIDRIGHVTMPVLFLHSPEDDVIPHAHGRRLHDATVAPKRFVDVRGGHDDAYRVDAEVYFGAIREFLGTLVP